MKQLINNNSLGYNKIIYSILLAIFLLVQNITAGILDCLSGDVCSCLCTSRVSEKWGLKEDGTYEKDTTYKKGCACGPGNRFLQGAGRYGNTSKRPGCLKQFSPPDFAFPFHPFPFTGINDKAQDAVPNATAIACAEGLSDDYEFNFNDYAKPRIRVRIQSCNLAACWAKTKTLSHGECVSWETGYVLPTKRICARIAYPATEDEPADMGYNDFDHFHLNKEGRKVADKSYPHTEVAVDEVTGDEFTVETMRQIDQPKLCAYNDPSAIEFLFLADWLDINPLRQPLHKTTQGSPIIDLVIFLIDAGLDLVSTLSKMMAGGDEEGGQAIGIILTGALALTGNVIGIILLIDQIAKAAGDPDFIKNILQTFNSFNLIVYGSYGCVNLPMGPLPPPYCSSLNDVIPVPNMYPICRTKHDGEIEKATINSLCHQSQVQNKYLKPAARIGYDKFIPECAVGESISNDCVSFFGADLLNILPNQFNYIQKCGATPVAPCVKTTHSSVFSWQCGAATCSGFRVLYGYNTGSSVNVLTSYPYRDDGSKYPACSSPTSNDCLVVYGINLGQHKDLSLSFPAIESAASNSYILSSTETITAPTATPFSASLSLKLPNQEDLIEGQSPKEICVYDNSDNYKIACQDRLPAPKPEIYSCSSPSISVSCSTTHTQPKAVAMVSSAGDTTQAVIEPPRTGKEEGQAINLAGSEYAAFVTDDDLRYPPFEEAEGHSTIKDVFVPSFRYGDYLNSSLEYDPLGPYDANGNLNSNIYVGGLEYENYYKFGGKKICLTGFDYSPCSLQDNKNCVLSTKNPDGSISNKLIDRIDPAGELGPILSDSQYFPYQSSGGSIPGDVSSYDESTLNSQVSASSNLNFDQATQGVRDKNPIEMNLCTAIPQPQCAAIGSSAASSNGNATWPTSDLSDSVKGTCMPMFESDTGQPERVCAYNKSTNTASYGAIKPGTECKPALDRYTLLANQNWQQIDISKPINSKLVIGISGEVSLCRSTTLANNPQQSSANGSSGQPVNIARLENTNTTLGTAIKYPANRPQDWYSIINMYEGDRVRILVSKNSTSTSNVTYRNAFTNLDESYSCASSTANPAPMCGRFCKWKDRPYTTHASSWYLSGDEVNERILGSYTSTNAYAAASFRELNTVVPPSGQKGINTDYDYYGKVLSNWNTFTGRYRMFYETDYAIPGIYQVMYNNTAVTDDNKGGYAFYIKHSKCVRKNGSYRSDSAFSGERGRVQVYWANSGENPNTTNPTTGISNLEFYNGLASHTVPKNGVMWMRILNNTADVADSYGSYSVSIGDQTCPAVLGGSAANGYAEWAAGISGENVSGRCILGYKEGPNGPPKKLCNSSGSYGALAAGTACVKDLKNCGIYGHILTNFSGPSGSPTYQGIERVYLDDYSNSTYALRGFGLAAGNDALECCTYNQTIKFNIRQTGDMDDFWIYSLAYEDHVIVKINGSPVHWGSLLKTRPMPTNGQSLGSTSINDISSASGGKVNYTTIGGATTQYDRKNTCNGTCWDYSTNLYGTTARSTNLRSYLINGENTITFRVISDGTGDYNIMFGSRMRCP